MAQYVLFMANKREKKFSQKFVILAGIGGKTACKPYQ